MPARYEPTIFIQRGPCAKRTRLERRFNNVKLYVVTFLSECPIIRVEILDK